MEVENSRLTSTYFSAPILSFVLGSSGVVLSVIPILIPNITRQTLISLISEIVIMGMSTICVTTTCLYLVYYKWKADMERGYMFERSTSVHASIWRFLRSKFRNPERYMLLMLVAFGLGSILCSLMKLAGSTRDVNSVVF